jgi:hypothetical protein
MSIHRAWISPAEQNQFKKELGKFGSGNGNVMVRRSEIEGLINKKFSNRSFNMTGIINSLIKLKIIESFNEDVVRILCKNIEIDEFTTKIISLSEEEKENAKKYFKEQNLKFFEGALFLPRIAKAIGTNSKKLGKRLEDANLVHSDETGHYYYVSNRSETVIDEITIEKVESTDEARTETVIDEITIEKVESTDEDGTEINDVFEEKSETEDLPEVIEEKESPKVETLEESFLKNNEAGAMLKECLGVKVDEQQSFVSDEISEAQFWKNSYDSSFFAAEYYKKELELKDYENRALEASFMHSEMNNEELKKEIKDLKFKIDKLVNKNSDLGSGILNLSKLFIERNMASPETIPLQLPKFNEKRKEGFDNTLFTSCDF